MRLIAFVAFVVAVSPCARAQCPNGTPPPCPTVRATTAPAAPAANSVAVLYFDARDTTDAFLAEGLSEEIATSLGHVPRLVVKIPSAVRRVQSANAGNIQAIGRALGVRWVVDGSVRRSGTQLRVSVRLVDAERETATWSNAFSPTTADLLAIQQDVAREVATGIVGALTPAERATVTARPTANAEAYEHYLKGNWYIGRRGQWLERAIEEYRAATRLDPTFDAPRAGIALANASTIDYGGALGPQVGGGRPGVVALADSVIQRNPSVVMAWIARGVGLAGLGRFTDARTSLERAIALDPNSVEAQFRLGQLYFREAEYPSARPILQRALALDPARPVTWELLGVVAYFERRLPDAVRMLDTAIALDPQYHLAMGWQIVALFASGDTARTRTIARLRAPLLPVSDSQTLLAAAVTFRDTVASVVMVGHLLPQARALAGRFEDALNDLSPLTFPVCRHMVRDPIFDPVRRDARFVAFEKACLALKE